MGGPCRFAGWWSAPPRATFLKRPIVRCLRSCRPSCPKMHRSPSWGMLSGVGFLLSRFLKRSIGQRAHAMAVKTFRPGFGQHCAVRGLAAGCPLDIRQPTDPVPLHRRTRRVAAPRSAGLRGRPDRPVSGRAGPRVSARRRCGGASGLGRASGGRPACAHALGVMGCERGVMGAKQGWERKKNTC